MLIYEISKKKQRLKKKIPEPTQIKKWKLPCSITVLKV